MKETTKRSFKPLTAADVAALNKSVLKYRSHAELTEASDIAQVGLGPADCPLCALYVPPYNLSQQRRCIGCPVHTHTGRIDCQDTPYSPSSGVDIAKLRRAVCVVESCVTIGAFADRCTEEADFLQSLLDNDPNKQTTTTMTNEEVLTKVQDLLRVHINTAERYGPATRLCEDLGFDSLDAIDFTVSLEEDFDFDIDDIDQAQIESDSATVQTVVDVVVRTLAAKGAPR